MTLDRMLNRASKLGAQGIEVIEWLPPRSPTDNPEGVWVTKNHNLDSCTCASEPLWYKK